MCVCVGVINELGLLAAEEPRLPKGDFNPWCLLANRLPYIAAPRKKPASGVWQKHMKHGTCMADLSLTVRLDPFKAHMLDGSPTKPQMPSGHKWLKKGSNTLGNWETLKTKTRSSSREVRIRVPFFLQSILVGEPSSQKRVTEKPQTSRVLSPLKAPGRTYKKKVKGHLAGGPR